MKYTKFKTVSIKNHPELNETWLQDRIAEDPKILGLGDLIMKDKERIQPKAGRLDLLLQDPNSNIRYEVEVQLGSLDESHIIRTIEYWDIERKRYPQYEHVAVIIAEDITSRFLNVISLFNGKIPLIAIQLSAITIGDNVGLVCTTVLDQIILGFDEEDVEKEVTDRQYWEKKATKDTVKLADEVLEYIKTFAPDTGLKYNKFYIALTQENRVYNFTIMRPMKNVLVLEIKLKQSDEYDKKFIDCGLDFDYSRWGQYCIRVTKTDIDKHKDALIDSLKQSFEEFKR